MRLTITIPTYNRNELLLGTVRALLPQLTPDCKLLIIDNCSDIPVAETLNQTLSEFRGNNVEIIRNRTNIGGNANILRCFEKCATDWLWTLADDLELKPDAISTILRSIDHAPEALYFNFYLEHEQHPRRTAPVVTKGMDGLIQGMDSFVIINISCGVWKVSSMLRSLKFGYQHIYSNAPHVVVLLQSLGGDGICYLSDEQIVRFVPPSLEEQGPMTLAFLGFPTILDMPLLSSSQRKTLATKMIARDRQIQEMTSLVHQLLLAWKQNGDHGTIMYIYNQICYRRFYFDSTLRGKVERFVGGALLRLPKISYYLVAMAYKMLRGEDTGQHRFRDWTKRT